MAAMAHTKRTETVTAVRVIIDAASESVIDVLNGGAAIRAVTTVARIVSAMRTALRIDSSRWAAKEEKQNSVDRDEKLAEADRPKRPESLSCHLQGPTPIEARSGSQRSPL